MVEMKVFRDDKKWYIVLENPPKAVQEKLATVMGGAINDLVNVLAPEPFDPKMEAAKIEKIAENEVEKTSAPKENEAKTEDTDSVESEKKKYPWEE